MKQINFLKKVLSKDQFDLLIAKIEQHNRFASIEFDFLQFNDDQAIIKVVQDQSFHGHYFDSKRLHEIVLETFSDALAPRKIMTSPVPFIPSEADIITLDLIRKVMSRYDIRNKDLETDLGINKPRISEWLAGKRSMSKPVRNMFYWYFLAKGYHLVGIKALEGLRKIGMPEDQIKGSKLSGRFNDA